MLKLCYKSITTLLSRLFQDCIDTSTFPDTWMKSNIVPVHKKGGKQIVDNYRPVSLIPILRKIFERIVLNSILSILKRIISLSSDLLILVNINFFQYYMRFINLLIVIHWKMSRVFSQIFLDRVWHDGLIYKIQCIGITGNFLKLIGSF